MNIAIPVQGHAVHVVEKAVGLQSFLAPECAAAVWQRAMPARFQAGLGRLDPDLLPRGRIILPLNQVPQAVAQLCDEAAMPQGPDREWLQADVASLAQIFAGLMSAQFLRLRLDIITSNACRKFHIDAITGRLVCTYRGTGTQYGFGTACNEPTEIFTVPTGSPILLRGTAWPAQPPSGLLHRSPPIEGTGETRLVLVLDPIEDPDAEE